MVDKGFVPDAGSSKNVQHQRNSVMNHGLAAGNPGNTSDTVSGKYYLLFMFCSGPRPGPEFLAPKAFDEGCERPTAV